MKNKVLAAFMAFIMLSGAVLAAFPVFAEGSVIEISSKKDFLRFAKKCTLDTYSSGKTVRLDCDIDFSGDDFEAVAIFNGTFLGGGHTISGIKDSGKGSYRGVFRYIGSTGRVSDLNVMGSITPSGSKSFVGGIVGENSGTVENCTFSGTVKGENVVGGIAGSNKEGGQIISCASSGSVVGENSSGGIAGKNCGFIKNCTNNASINTVYEEKKTDISKLDADAGALLESYKNAEEESEEKSILGHTDTGGIAGYSSGIISGCTNNAYVGYEHIGYNVGGIAGRQSGYILGCKNYGTVRGRKDVGGIVGQAEPYILLSGTENNLKNLRTELNRLSNMVDKFITDTDALGTDARSSLKGISKSASAAADNAQILVDTGTDFIDDNISEINAQSAILSNTLDKLESVFDNLSESSSDASEALYNLSDAIDEFDSDASGFKHDLSSAVRQISNAEQDIEKAIEKAKKAGRDFDEAISAEDKSEILAALSDMSAAIKEIAQSKQTIRDCIAEIEEILGEKPESLEGLGVNTQKILQNLKTISESNKTIISSLKTISQSLDALVLNTSIDFKKFKSAAENMQDSLLYIENALLDISRGIKKFADAFDNITVSKDGKESLSQSFKKLSYAADDLKTALGDARDIISDLANEEPLEFVKLGDDFRAASDNLFDSLSDISGELDKLDEVLSRGGDEISGDLTAINSQFNVVMNLLIGEIEDLTDQGRSLEDIFVDVSDEDIKSVRQGKVEDCHNFGNIEADRNTGGICGALAIEYMKDPEDEIEKPTSLNFTYKTRAVLQSCINEGKVTGKKDCVGGIAGCAEIGTIYECENYAAAKSSNGNYVGGIAGKSESAIRRSYSKANYSGKRYVGGIAGKANKVSASYAIARVSGDENKGAICGLAENDSLFGNFFIDFGTGAVDGISLSEKAEPIEYEALAAIDGIPSRFVSFKVTFESDGEVIKTQEIKYGEETDRIKYPPVPEKEGYYGKWKKVKAKTVTEDITVNCKWAPYITVISSEEKDESGKIAIALCEGEFTDEARLSAKKSASEPPVHKSENVKVYDIKIENSDIKDNEAVTLRLINKNRDKVTAWVLNGDKWEKTEVKNEGKYVILKAKGASQTICLKYEPSGHIMLWSLLALLLILSAAAVVLKKKGVIKKRRSTKENG